MAGMNFSYAHGDEVELDDEIAKAWVEANIADIAKGVTAKNTKKGDE